MAAPATAASEILQAGAFTRQQAEALLKFQSAITLTAAQIIAALGYTPVPDSRTISAGAGLVGGGDLTANRTLAIDPAVLTAIGNALPLTSSGATSNAVTGAGHTHQLDGVLPLSSGTATTNSATAPGHTHQIISTTVGAAFLNLANPGAIRFPRINADNSVSALDAAAFRTAIGAAASTDLGSYVLKAGDTMTGTLTLAASYGLRFSGSAGGRFRVLDDTGNPSLQWTNAGETAFSVGRYVATEHRFTLGPLDAYAGARVFSATQLRIYDTNNDTPLEIGVGYNTGNDRNGYIWNRNNGFLSFGTNNTQRIRIQAGGSVDVSAQLSVINNNLVVSGGDIYAYRAAGTTGVIFLRSDATRYLFYDGTNYVMPGGGLYIGGQIQSDALTFTGLSGNQGFQMVWNTVQAGQGRFEFINNRGGGSGGFTWWDRANTGAGTGTALALLHGAGFFVNGVIQFATGASTPGQLSSHPVFGTDYATLMGAAFTGQEYAVLFSRAGADANTYISSITGGTVKIRPSANSTTGEVTFATTGVTFAQAATGPNFIATSDQTLKHDDGIAELYDQLERLEIHDYRWIKDGKRGRGVMAQQARKIAPAYVYVDANGKLGVDKAGLAIEIALRALRLASQRR